VTETAYQLRMVAWLLFGGRGPLSASFIARCRDPTAVRCRRFCRYAADADSRAVVRAGAGACPPPGGRSGDDVQGS